MPTHRVYPSLTLLLFNTHFSFPFLFFLAYIPATRLQHYTKETTKKLNLNVSLYFLIQTIIIILPIWSFLEYESGIIWSCSYTQKDIKRIERLGKYFLSFAGYVLKISHPPHKFIHWHHNF